MEKLTFTDPRMQARFDEMVLLQMDVTANNADDQTTCSSSSICSGRLPSYSSTGREKKYRLAE